MREKLLGIIEKNSRVEIKELAIILGVPEIDVANELKAMEEEGIICGYHTLIDWEKTSIEKQLVDSEMAEIIHRKVHELAEPYKEVFYLRVFGELSFEKIGALFGKNANWACVTYHRAKTRIQNEMENLK